MENNLDILYKVENLIQVVLSEYNHEYLEESLQLLNEIISDIELSSIESTDEDDETYIPLDLSTEIFIQ